MIATNPELRLASHISGLFFVPSYQRGYRWGRPEVEAFLNDIYADGKRPEDAKYCLQPIVVKTIVADSTPMEGKPPPGEIYYELIDGQQRLTTLYLLYLQLKKLKGVAPRFNLWYETRKGSTEYLRNPVAAGSSSNIDYFHIYDALQCIEEWFAKTAAKASDGELAGVADDMYRYLRNQVEVIWYDAGNEGSIDLFTRLNVGRIPLTNAELVKALLLAGKDVSPTGGYRQIEIATQWDEFERALQDDKFWAFLTNRKTADYPTRIELLFDLLAEKSAKEAHAFFTFDWFRSQLFLNEQKNIEAGDAPSSASGIAQLAAWKPVRELYELLREWFGDRERYHKVGYLVAVGDDLSALVQHAKPKDREAPLKSDLVQFLDERIKEKLDLDESSARGLDYLSRHHKCEQLLLLFNVESVRGLKHSTELYPFDSHKRGRDSWSLEHIHAQNAEPLSKEEEWRAWLNDSRQALQTLPRLEPPETEGRKLELIEKIERVLTQPTVMRKHFDQLAPGIAAALEPEGADSETHSISNLALLSADVNSALGNGSFYAKRLRIQQLDQDGAFIPICTRRVFLKYYTPSDHQGMHLWSRKDREAYLNSMFGHGDTGQMKAGLLLPYLKKSTPQEDAKP